MATTESLTVYPAEYLESESTHGAANYTDFPIGKGVDNSTYASFYLNDGIAGTAKIYYRFDLSAIPQDATIDSVVCKIKASVSTTTNILTCNVSVCTGTTKKETSGELSTSASTYTLDTATWTRSELDDCRVCLNAVRSRGSTSVYMRFYGAELTVVYTYEGQTFLLKTNGVWTEVSAVYKKADGAWVEQEDLQSLFDTSANYVKGAMT